MSKFDITSVLKWNLFTLKLIGLWPDRDSYTWNFYLLYAIIFVLGFELAFTSFQTTYAFFLKDDLNALMSLSSVLCTEYTNLFKVYTLMRNMKMLKRLLKALHGDSFQPKNPTERSLMEEKMRFWERIYSIFRIFLLFTVFMWALIPLLDNLEYNFPIDNWYPWNYRQSPHYEFTYIYQSLSILAIALSNQNMDMLIAGLMVYIAVECDILCQRLRNISREQYASQLVECIQHHQDILQFAGDANRFFNLIVLTQFACSVANVALIMFQLTTVDMFGGDFWTTCGYLATCLNEIFIYCWFGNEVILASEKIPRALFESEWLDAAISTKKNVNFFMMRVQHPIKLTSVKMFTLSLETFMKILQSAWSYFAMLQQVSD